MTLTWSAQHKILLENLKLIEIENKIPDYITIE
jgi:hypothetical protein